jgi:molybdate transport system ATP-binding protein
MVDLPTQKMPDRFIAFEGATLRIRDRRILPDTDWVIERHQNWAVLGPNGAGKSTLLRAFTGRTPVVGGSIRRYRPSAQPNAIGFISFELHQQLIARDQAGDASRCFSGDLDSWLTVEQIVERVRHQGSRNRRPVDRMLSAFDVASLMPRPIRKLSTGEMRKVLILRAVMQAEDMLILDEPFAGLDQGSRQQLTAALDALVQTGMQIVLATHRYENILPAISHILLLKEGGVFRKGPRAAVLTPSVLSRVFGSRPVDAYTPPVVYRSHSTADLRGKTVVEIKNATVRYGSAVVFENLSWRMKRGENWAIVGPNGSGKTTLLQLITADHPQAYSNEVYLFGKRRGSGESIWEIKQRLGQLSSEFQIDYRKAIRSFDVVLSGFFSSVGLYRRASDHQREVAAAWMRKLGLAHLKERRYDLLSFGEKRLVLLARAMVTSPPILVLDEPCQGLDPYHRRRILEWIDSICDALDTQLLYVTHHIHERPACITHVFDLKARTAGSVSELGDPLSLRESDSALSGEGAVRDKG